ncbi:hypothetical protein CHU98_g6779 [Xylaria longipes]|nr:hypothetical protein CHU98_g6779 [Xylaria longipes]
MSPLLRATSRCVVRSGRSGASSLWRLQPQFRSLASESSQNASQSQTAAPDTPFDVFKNSLNNLQQHRPPSTLKIGSDVFFFGFLGKRRDKGSNLSFCDFQTNSHVQPGLQIVSNWEEEGSVQHKAHLDLKSVPAYSPVYIEGTLQERKAATRENDKPAHERSTEVSPENYDIALTSIQCLNTFPKDIVVSKDAVWSLKSRHLQMRFDPLLRERLRFRHAVAECLRRRLRYDPDFTEVETPVLFKSTPEGAREFLVPTRRKGFAYALPQSPQQYKQILMAGGVLKYFQFAKCFRDEDHRADRQPEFTQFLAHDYVITEVNGIRHPRLRTEVASGNPPFYLHTGKIRIPILTYQNAMLSYGTDKPDLRMNSPQVSCITPIDKWLPQEFKRMITSLQDPVVEACKFRFTGSTQQSAEFIKEFFDTLPNTPHKLGSVSTPGVFVFDSSKPLKGLSALGHEAAEKLALRRWQRWEICEDGDVIIIHARERKPFNGGSTELGRLRKLIYDTAVEKGLLPKDDSFRFVWVTNFPMFSPNDGDPGQGGSAGFSATHHPFTAPSTPKDVDLLRTDPLLAEADHYDLVLNGVEIGGGSRRIHVAEVQEYVMRDVLKMTDEGVGQFSHLLDALKAGCPPHAGFALGFDRLLSILCDVPSVRDVIAFPKNNKGEDQLVGSPSKTTPAQQKTYHLFTEPEPETKLDTASG